MTAVHDKSFSRAMMMMMLRTCAVRFRVRSSLKFVVVTQRRVEVGDRLPGRRIETTYIGIEWEYFVKVNIRPPVVRLEPRKSDRRIHFTATDIVLLSNAVIVRTKDLV